MRKTAAALDKKELPTLEPGAMCYMMSKRQYLNDRRMSWYPHLMFFVSGDAAKSWEPTCQVRRLLPRMTLKRAGDNLDGLGWQLVGCVASSPCTS
jgi:hypothetical protein